jgi:hypothetical protein
VRKTKGNYRDTDKKVCEELLSKTSKTVNNGYNNNDNNDMLLINYIINNLITSADSRNSEITLLSELEKTISDLETFKGKLEKIIKIFKREDRAFAILFLLENKVIYPNSLNKILGLGNSNKALSRLKP